MFVVSEGEGEGGVGAVELACRRDKGGGEGGFGRVCEELVTDGKEVEEEWGSQHTFSWLTGVVPPIS